MKIFLSVVFVVSFLGFRVSADDVYNQQAFNALVTVMENDCSPQALDNFRQTATLYPDFDWTFVTQTNTLHVIEDTFGQSLLSLALKDAWANNICVQPSTAYIDIIASMPGVDLNQPTGYTETLNPLTRAVFLNDETELLADFMARPETKFNGIITAFTNDIDFPLISGVFLANADNCTAMEYYASYGDASNIQNLIKAGKAGVNDGTQGSTPLISAAGFGNLPVVQVLLSLGADVNVRNNLGYTALDAATKSGADSHFSPVGVGSYYNDGIFGDHHGVPVDPSTRAQIIELLQQKVSP